MTHFTFATPAADVEHHVRTAAKRTPTILDHIPVRRATPVLQFKPSGVDRRPFAQSRDPCARCEIRGDLGCMHQRPYEGADHESAALDVARRGGQHLVLQPRSPFTPEEDARVLQLRSEGLTQGEIGERIGRSSSSVGSCIDRLRKAGVILSPPITQRPFDDAEVARIHELRALGRTYAEIAADTNRALGSIATFFRNRKEALDA